MGKNYSGDAATPPSAGDEGGTFIATVLIIEDTEEIRLPVAKFLRKNNFRVFDTGDGRDGLDLYRAHLAQIDIIVLDLTLPSMSGEEILEELQTIKPNIKVIVTTSHGIDRALAAVRGSESWSYIRKPYQFTELMDALGKHLPEKRI